MHLELRPNRTSALVPFQACCLQTLDSCEFASTHSAMSIDGTLTWIYKGPILEVVSTSSGHRVASINVGHLLHDVHATVACASEFHCQGRSRLLVGINGSAEQGMIVLLDIPTSLVIKAVEIPQKVTAVQTILTHGGQNIPQWAFSEQLRQFYGIIAVGTQGGYIYLVDMSLDTISNTTNIDSSQKVAPSLIILLEPREKDIAYIRKQAELMGRHLVLCLGMEENMNSNDCFHFRRPDLTVVQSFNEDEIQVTSLRYIPQSGTLAVGYSFGGFHLWKLFNPVLEYTSSVEPEDLPVAYFVYQEPENDPKNFAYIWVCRDDQREIKQESQCSVSLYQLSYSRRNFYANYGNFYEELNSVTLRLDHILTMDPYNSQNTSTWSSELLSADLISFSNYHPLANLIVNDSFEEGCQGPDLSLCAFVWTAQDSRNGGQSEVFFSIFDMNRWYHSQMPSRIKCVNVGGQEICPFFAVYHMNDAVCTQGLGNLLNMQLKPGSLLRFVNNSPMPPEQHFYPSSLAFETVCVLSNGIISVYVLGIQRQVLALLESGGPACLLKPFDLHHRCVQTGLLARSAETSPAALNTEEYQRKSLLTLALDQGMIRFITACIHSWADGEFYQQGCTLQFLLSWTWERVNIIKHQIDITCKPLFDWRGAPVDQRMLQILQSCLCCLGHLKSILYILLTQSASVSDQGQMELEQRMQVVNLLHSHLKIILWFIHNRLLPEHDEAGRFSPSHYVYPASELTQVFKDRRLQVSKLQSGVEAHEMILIDALVHSAGDAVHQLWEKENGTGMYPPSSLHAALSIYLLEDVLENTKHAIMLYLLFDMAAVAHGQQEQFAEKIPLFAKTYDLPAALVQQIHGFWLIDHMNFEEGLNQLLQHGSCQDLGPWQHACILQALMQQGEFAAAWRYLSMCGPPVLTTEDLRMRLTVLVANGLVSQAVIYVRHNCGPTIQKDMLRHIFMQCQQRRLMELLFKVSFTDDEEQFLQNYLSSNADSIFNELLVLHFLEMAQYVPAIQLNDRMKHRATMDMSARSRDRAKVRNALVDGFCHALPATQQYLINNSSAGFKLTATKKIDVPRPKPLSTVITQRAEQRASSQSSLILAVMVKVAEAGKLLVDNRQDEGDRKKEESTVHEELKHTPNAHESNTVGIGKPGPFLYTPSTPKVCSRISLAGPVVYPAVTERYGRLLSIPAVASAFPTPAKTALRRSQVFTADCLTLLQTPKIDHTPARPVSPQKTATPHSILKVSSLGRMSSASKGTQLSPEVYPKQLRYSSSLNSSTSTTAIPSCTSSPAGTTSPKFTRSAADLRKHKSEQDNAGVATPKQIRFAEPEICDISPAYVSPDSLARPPLRPSVGHDKKESPPCGVLTTSDDEITFNFSRQVTGGSMDTDDAHSFPSIPMGSTFLTSDTSSYLLSISSAPSDGQLLVEDRQKSKSSIHKSQSCTNPQNVSPRDHVADISPRKFTTINPKEMSPLAVRIIEESANTSKQNEKSSPQRSHIRPSASSSEYHEVIAETYIERETRHNRQVSEGKANQREAHFTSEKTVQTTKDLLVFSEKASLNIPPVIECEDGSQTIPDYSVEAMETMEPSEESILLSVRQADPQYRNVREEMDNSDTIEIAVDDGVLDTEVAPPTPIQHFSLRSSPERLLKSSRSRRQAKVRHDLASSSVEPDSEMAQPTPPKLSRISPERITSASHEEMRTDQMPALQLEVDAKKNSIENHSYADPYSSPARRSTRRSASHSPPSPARRSSYRSRDHNITQERLLKDPAASAEKESLTVQTESSSDAAVPVPVSPSRRSTRVVRTPERYSEQSVSFSDKTVETTLKVKPPNKHQLSPKLHAMGSEEQPMIIPFSSLKQSENSDLALSPSRRSTRYMKSNAEDIEEPKSPSRRSARRLSVSTLNPASRQSVQDSDRQTRSSLVSSPSRLRKKTAGIKDSEEYQLMDVEDPLAPAIRMLNPSQSEERPDSLPDDKTSLQPVVNDSNLKISQTSPSRRSARGKSKTPERLTEFSVVSSKDKRQEAGTSVVHDIALVTEEVRISRKLLKEKSPKKARVTGNTGDTPSFQFAPPTPLARIQVPDSSKVLSSDIVAFTFSPPITRSANNQRTSTLGSTSMLTMEKDSTETAQDLEPSTDKALSTSASKTKERKTTKRWKLKKVPGASPTDSPINIVSPGEPSSGTARPERGSKLPSRRSQAKPATHKQVLRKRKAKLW